MLESSDSCNFRVPIHNFDFIIFCFGIFVLAQKQDALNLFYERTMPITNVTLSKGNLHFGFTNNNLNRARGLSLNIKVSEVSKEMISCFRTISTVTYRFNKIFNIMSKFIF